VYDAISLTMKRLESRANGKVQLCKLQLQPQRAQGSPRVGGASFRLPRTPAFSVI